MSSLIHCFAAIAESIKEKQKLILQGPPPPNGYLNEISFRVQENMA